MKSIYEHKFDKAVKRAAKTQKAVTFWFFGSDGNGDVADRQGWLTAYPDGEVWAHYSHHYDGSTHYMEYSQRIC
jgi:hypothetical protein